MQHAYNGVMAETARPSRAQQRERTRARILEAARRAFGEHGYDRATVRAVAAAAEVNPGLVMHYFGSKQELFAEATHAPPEEPIAGVPDQPADQMLAALHAKLVDEPAETLAMLRSMLTHPEATRDVRESLARQQRELGGQLREVDDAELRIALAGAISLGVVVGRYLLQLDGLRDAAPERITELLRPGIESLVAGPG